MKKFEYHASANLHPSLCQCAGNDRHHVSYSFIFISCSTISPDRFERHPKTRRPRNSHFVLISQLICWKPRCWCVQLAPQVWRNYRTKSTEGLPTAMMFLWALSCAPFEIYAVLQRFNVPIQIQPACCGALCLICWGQCLIYGR